MADMKLFEGYLCQSTASIVLYVLPIATAAAGRSSRNFEGDAFAKVTRWRRTGYARFSWLWMRLLLQFAHLLLLQLRLCGNDDFVTERITPWALRRRCRRAGALTTGRTIWQLRAVFAMSQRLWWFGLHRGSLLNRWKHLVEIVVIATDEHIAVIFKQTIHAGSHHFARAWFQTGQMETSEARTWHRRLAFDDAGQIGIYRKRKNTWLMVLIFMEGLLYCILIPKLPSSVGSSDRVMMSAALRGRVNGITECGNVFGCNEEEKNHYYILSLYKKFKSYLYRCYQHMFSPWCFQRWSFQPFHIDIQRFLFKRHRKCIWWNALQPAQ